LKPKELVKFEMEICEECKVPFVKIGDSNSKLCERCKEFVEEFGFIFTLAKDLEK
jgi:ribosomal protein L7Ae-like RNA K-turn-binding protein